MFEAGLAVAPYIRMTRSFGSRTATRRVARVMRPVRDPSITTRSFTCFRLIPIDDGEPDEPAFAPIELCVSPNMMGAFMRLG